jgi:predicted transcriptional regulator with HTH domain
MGWIYEIDRIIFALQIIHPTDPNNLKKSQFRQKIFLALFSLTPIFALLSATAVSLTESSD